MKIINNIGCICMIVIGVVLLCALYTNNNTTKELAIVYSILFFMLIVLGIIGLFHYNTMD